MKARLIRRKKRAWMSSALLVPRSEGGTARTQPVTDGMHRHWLFAEDQQKSSEG